MIKRLYCLFCRKTWDSFILSYRGVEEVENEGDLSKLNQEEIIEIS